MSTKIAGIEHLKGNLYRVQLGLIKFSEQTEADVLTFSNPRLLTANPKPKGLGKDEMNELREAIRTEGLENPLLLRWIDVDGERTLQLVGGERRKRCLDKLVGSDVECYDPATESWKKASEMYEYVDCRINEMDDQSAFKHAFSENECSVGIGDGATIGLIGEFRKADWTDDQILQTTGKSISWLRDTDILLGLDEKTLTALTSEEINRASALQLAQVEDIQERIELLETAKKFAVKRLDALKSKLTHEVEVAENKVEIAKAQVVEAEMKHQGAKKQAAEAKIEKVQKRIDDKKHEIEELEEVVPIINSKDIHRAKNKAAAASSDLTEEQLEDGKSLTNAKLAKHWVEPLSELIKEWDGIEDQATDLQIDLCDAKLVLLLIDAKNEGNKDILGLLEAHKLTKEIDLPFDEEDMITTESLEDEDDDDDAFDDDDE